MSEGNEVLQKNLTNPAKKNATYISPDIQNQLIQMIGIDIIQSNVVKEIREAKLYSIIVDEATSHNKEKLSFCIRFVDGDRNIREEFIEFVSVIRTSEEALASALLRCLENLGLPVEDIRGHGYDGTSSMSSERAGVQARLRREAPKALYTHCSSHALNLVIAHSCSLPFVRNVLGNVKETFLFFPVSPKREALLKDSRKIKSSFIEQQKCFA